MTNLAFTSLIILILAFPGYVFHCAYFSHQFTRQVLVRSWTDDLAKAILTSLPFHVIGVLIVEWLRGAGYIHHTLDAEMAFRVLAGEFSNTGGNYKHTFAEVIDHLYRNQLYLLIYYFLILGAAWGIGHLLRHLIWEYELDVKAPRVFGFRSPWIYSILGRGQLEGVRSSDTLVWIDALTDEPTETTGKTRMYRGLVAGFTTDDKGTLRDLILTAARRSKFTAKEDGTMEFSWRRIQPGDYFLIRYNEIKNLNITYLSSVKQAPDLSSEAVPPERSDQAGRTSQVP